MGAGFFADANVLIQELRVTAERYRFQYGAPMPLEQLVIQICDRKHRVTQFGGNRPYGVSLLFAGYDKRNGFQLYLSDPSGNYGGWKATCIGNNSATAQSILKSDWTEELDLEGGISLALKILNKTLDVQKLSDDRFELAMLQQNDDGESEFSFLSTSEKKRRCAILAEEVEKQKKEAAAKLKEQQRKEKERQAQSSSTK